LGGGDALGEAAEDQHDFGESAMRPLRRGAGEGIEDPAAAEAAVVEHRGAMAAVDAEAIGGLAARAGQADGWSSETSFW
jgi:hypothetical protein